LILDTFCEVYDLLEPWAIDSFYDIKQHTMHSGCVYVLGRQQFVENAVLLRELIEKGDNCYILSNPHEGSETMKYNVMRFGASGQVLSKKLLLLSGGDMEPEWINFAYENFITKVFDMPENLEATQRTPEIFENTNKPYKFLFLNGRGRAHRKYLLERWELNGLLDQTLWSNLARSVLVNSKHIKFEHNGIDLMRRPREYHFLDKRYEIPRYITTETDREYSDYSAKLNLFNNEWGDVYINPEAYIATYFSVVTETVFEYPYSFRTEKIWKPIGIGHPWIAVANQHFYRDIKNLGFKTFGHLIDESFDNIENSQERIERIADVVEDLCRQDLSQFLLAAQDVCKYNQQHMLELAPQVRARFPEQFFQFLDQHV
jgi:hypothetical protein